MTPIELFTERFNRFNHFETVQEHFAKINIFVSIIPDAFKYDTPCWRGIMEWKEDGVWQQDDCGCYPSAHECRLKITKMAMEYCLDQKIDFINV